jgi:Skp family chaperone for outer membrane proteins
MEFRVANFEKLSQHFTVYQDGIKSLEEKRNEFLEKIEPIRKEMQQILLASQSGLVIDNKTEKQRMERFQLLQEQAQTIDKDAKFHLAVQKDDLTREVYKKLEEIISEWSIANSIDIVIGKLEVVYMNDRYEITDTIIDILKGRNLYVDNLKTEKESVY